MAKKQKPSGRVVGRQLTPDEIARATGTGRYANQEPRTGLSKAQSILLGSLLVGSPLTPEIRARLEAEIAAEKAAKQQAEEEVVQLEQVAPSDIMHPDIAGRHDVPVQPQDSEDQQ